MLETVDWWLFYYIEWHFENFYIIFTIRWSVVQADKNIIMPVLIAIRANFISRLNQLIQVNVKIFNANTILFVCKYLLMNNNV